MFACSFSRNEKSTPKSYDDFGCCSSKNIVRNGIRKLNQTGNQRYLCTNCGKRFSAKKGKFETAKILFALNTYNSGRSLAKTAAHVSKKFKISIEPSTILRWARKYSHSYHRIRKKLLAKYDGKETIVSKQFVHSGLMYCFMLHEPKIQEFCKYEGLKNYLLGLDNWIDDYFSSGTRCSQLKTVIGVDLEEKKNLLCDAVNFVLEACTDLKERHSLIQKFLLYNDSSTLAVEVPVFMYDKALGNVCGHIDIVQVRFGKIWIIDYKPNARGQDKLKVASQLYSYARALSFRSKVPLSEFRCCYFDSEICFEFDPNKVKLDMKKEAGPSKSPALQ